ncbi:DUF305 domain-containing protein [Streptomyces sp. MUM 178J]|uniref:DUF305 domain-containing protein n=1 Tax=Streptomyces sp. MUM 178J TaxID=2791991 RepID=UPI001F041846|nr:DUF305 domain-containing protein [Streptomyces sp. MUM 178J]WRQ79149.1 DUF305 domain-containing protein [Streptomyces sp. MUM 178J]
MSGSGSGLTRTHRAAIAAVVLALLFAGAAAVSSAVGRGDAGAPPAPSTDSPDAGFARDMSVHHQQAVEMSFIVRDRTDDEDVRRLAYDIANTQANQRGMMLGWLDLWGLPAMEAGSEPMAWMADADGHGGQDDRSGGQSDHPAGDGPLMPGMATKKQLEGLRAASGRDAEIRFLRLMIAHHEGGVAMAEACVGQCAVEPQRKLAQGMVDAQRSEVELMTDLLRKRGAEVAAP